MARRKTLPDSVRAKYELAERLSSLRAEMYGDRGGPELARQLGLPVRTWYNYESGVTVPAEVILRIIELTSVEPTWLLHGKGEKFRSADQLRPESAFGQGFSVGSLLRTALQILENSESASPPATLAKGSQAHGQEETSDVVLVAVDDSAGVPITRMSGPRYVAARGEWLDAERECRCIRIEGDDMSPIVASGAYVAFAKAEEHFTSLDGKMVVAWVDSQPIVRWFQYCSRYALLRAENQNTVPVTTLIDLEQNSPEPRFRRVLWINTPH
jgi:hypothetical protein